jgi:hypothetical protein
MSYQRFQRVAHSTRSYAHGRTDRKAPLSSVVGDLKLPDVQLDLVEKKELALLDELEISWKIRPRGKLL